MTSSYGERLDLGLRRPGKDRKGLADAMGISLQAVGQQVTGITKSASAANCASASLYLDCDPIWLATGKGAPGWGYFSKGPLTSHVIAESSPSYGDSISGAISKLGKLLAGTDGMVAGAIGDLLSKLAHHPEEADSIGAIVEAMVTTRSKRTGT